MEPVIISVREHAEYADRAIHFFQQSWPEVLPVIYEDSIRHCIGALQPLPQWYLLLKDDNIIGCAGLITNDFISRSELYPWICAIFIDPAHRGNNYAQLLISKAMQDTKRFGFRFLNLCTDHTGYYERFGFTYIGQGYHPWEESSRIYQIEV